MNIIDEIVLTKDPSGVLANDILAEFGKSIEYDDLKVLLYSDDERLAEIGSFILCELGNRCLKLKHCFVDLLRHSSWKVRFSVSECPYYLDSKSDPSIIFSSMKLLEDESDNVKWKSMINIRRQQRNFIQDIADYLEVSEMDDQHATGLKMIASFGEEHASQLLQSFDASSELGKVYRILAISRHKNFYSIIPDLAKKRLPDYVSNYIEDLNFNKKFFRLPL